MKDKLNDKDKKILKSIYPWKNTGQSLYEISKDTGISWVTVKKRVKVLSKKKLVKISKKGNIKFNYKLL